MQVAGTPQAPAQCQCRSDESSREPHSLSLFFLSAVRAARALSERLCVVMTGAVKGMGEYGDRLRFLGAAEIGVCPHILDFSIRPEIAFAASGKRPSRKHHTGHRKE